MPKVKQVHTEFETRREVCICPDQPCYCKESKKLRKELDKQADQIDMARQKVNAGLVEILALKRQEEKIRDEIRELNKALTKAQSQIGAVAKSVKSKEKTWEEDLQYLAHSQASCDRLRAIMEGKT
jgi:predicted  nucleic acid-binding Zn-ribbon protein